MFLFDLSSFTWSNITGTSWESSETKCRTEYKCTTFVIICLWQKLFQNSFHSSIITVYFPNIDRFFLRYGFWFTGLYNGIRLNASDNKIIRQARNYTSQMNASVNSILKRLSRSDAYLFLCHVLSLCGHFAMNDRGMQCLNFNLIHLAALEMHLRVYSLKILFCAF